MGIRCHCPRGHKLNLKAFLAGRLGVCPECGTRFRIPLESEGKESAAAVASRDEDEGTEATTASGADSSAKIGRAATTSGAMTSGAMTSGATTSGGATAVASRGAAARPGAQVSARDSDEQFFDDLGDAVKSAAAPTHRHVATPVTSAPSPAAPPQPSASVSTGASAPAAVPAAAAAVPAAAAAVPAAAAVSVPAVASVPLAAGVAMAAVAVAPQGMAAPPATPAPPSLGRDPIDEAPHAVWYVRPPSGGQFGPARGEVMRRWVREGRVTPDSMVWREGWADWRSAKDLFVEPKESAAAVPMSPATDTKPKDAGAVAERLSKRRRRSKTLSIVALIGLALLSIGAVVALVMVL